MCWNPYFVLMSEWNVSAFLLNWSSKDKNSLTSDSPSISMYWYNLLHNSTIGCKSFLVMKTYTESALLMYSECTLWVKTFLILRKIWYWGIFGEYLYWMCIVYCVFYKVGCMYLLLAIFMGYLLSSPANANCLFQTPLVRLEHSFVHMY